MFSFNFMILNCALAKGSGISYFNFWKRFGNDFFGFNFQVIFCLSETNDLMY